MVHVFQGIFTYEVTLFYGEQAEYEIYRDGEQGQPVASGTLTAHVTKDPAKRTGDASCQIPEDPVCSVPEQEAGEIDSRTGVMTRYQTINRLLAMEEAQDGELGKYMMEYGKKLELLERLFRLL